MLDSELVRCGVGCVLSSTASLTLILPIKLSLSCSISDYLMKTENIWCLLWTCMEPRMENDVHAAMDRLGLDSWQTATGLFHITLATQHVPMCLITPYQGIKIHNNYLPWRESGEKGEIHYYSKVLKCLAILTPFLLASLPQLPFSYIQLHSFSAFSIRSVTEGL